MIRDLAQRSNFDTATSHSLSTMIILVVLLVLRIATAVLALIGYHFLDKGLLPSWVWLRTVGPWINSGFTTGLSRTIGRQGCPISKNLDTNP